MSKIEAKVSEVTEIKPKRNEDRQDFLRRLVEAASALDDDTWEELDEDAQNWVNTAADAMNANAQTIPEPPDAEKPAASGRTRTRTATKEEDKTPTGTKEIKVDDIDLGMFIRVVTKRKDLTGTVTEAGKEDFVLKLANGDEEEIDYDRVEKAYVLDTDGGDDAGAEDSPGEPQVGDTVRIVNKRGKVIEGEIEEIDGDELIIKTSSGIEEVKQDRIEELKILGGKKSEKEEKPEASTRRSRTTPKDSKEEKEGKDEKPARSSNRAGVSVGGRIREIMCEKGNEDITLEEVDKQLRKEKIEFRDTSSRMIYKDVKHVLELLAASKRLK